MESNGGGDEGGIVGAGKAINETMGRAIWGTRWPSVQRDAREAMERQVRQQEKQERREQRYERRIGLCILAVFVGVAILTVAGAAAAVDAVLRYLGAI